MESRNHREDGDRPTKTAVPGIYARFDTSSHAGANGQRYRNYSPVFRVQTVAASGERVDRSFPLQRHGYAGAWGKAVECAARAWGLKRWAHLRRQRPAPAQFAAVREAMLDRGHEIPESKLPDSTTGVVERPSRRKPRPAQRSPEFTQIKRTRTKLDILGHLAGYGRADPDRLATLYFGHIHAQRDTDGDATVRRAAARHALQRMAAYGLVRVLANGDAKVTAAGRRFLTNE